MQVQKITAKQGRPWVWLIAAVLIAYAARAYHLDHFSFWIDEALTPLRTKQALIDIIAGRTFLQEAVSQDTHPPLYYLIVFVTRRLWGDSDFAYRYVSLLFGVLLIPLMYQFGRRMFTRQVGLVAAFFTAVNPLQVWYGQEARMYTMLVFLGVLASYVVWRGVEETGRQRDEETRGISFGKWKIWVEKGLLKWLGWYVLAAGVLLYTHYTAVFLLAGHGLIWAWVLWRNGHQKLILGGIGLGMLAAIPIAPLTIPRLFTGAESGYVYLRPSVMVNDLVGGFSMGVTAPQGWGTLFWWGFAALLVVAFVMIGREANGRIKFSFLLIYLSFTLIGLALGSLLKPMYQGVRHIMLSSPAMYLLLAAAVGWPTRNLIGRTTQVAGLLFVLGASLMSLNNLYFNNEVAKDDLRAVVAFVEEQAGQNDMVVYNDAILMLAHLHYQTRDDLAVTALPVYPYAVRPETTELLTSINEQYDRFWFVPPVPTDGRDQNRVVRAWVAENMTLLDSTSFTARSTNLKVELYGTAAFVERETAVADSLNLQWEGLPTLHQLTIVEQNADELWLDALWQGELTTGDLRLLFILQGVDDWVWTEDNRPFWLSNGEWPDDQLRHLPYRVDVPDRVPPGQYLLRVRGWDQDGDRPLGDWQTVAEVNITERPVTSAPTRGVRFANGMGLLEARPLGTIVRPGHRVPILTEWYSATGGDEIGYELQLFQDDVLIVEQSGRPGARWLESWPTENVIGGHVTVLVPENATGGEVELRWRLLENGEPVNGRVGWWPLGREWNTLGTFDIDPWPLETEVPAVENMVNAQFNNEVTLIGYDVDVQTDKLDINLVWQTIETPPLNYLVFVHFVDTESGEVVSQVDAVPVQSQRLTKGWRPGEVIIDPHTLDLRGVSSGTYQLNVGLYHPESDSRPAVFVDGVEEPTRQVFLGEVER